MYDNIKTAHDLIILAESYLESALVESNPQHYLHDLIAVSLRNISVIHSKLEVAESLAQQSI